MLSVSCILVSEPELQIITQHIVREKIYVSLADGISGIHLPNSRLICSFLESVYVIQTEVSFDLL